MPVAAVVREQQGVGLALGVAAPAGAVEQARDRLAGLGAHHCCVDVSALGLGQDLGLTGLDAGLRGDDSESGVAVGVHEAQGDDPVEPGVGNLVGDRRLASFTSTGRGDGLLQSFHGLGLLHPLGRRRGQHDGDPGCYLADE